MLRRIYYQIVKNPRYSLMKLGMIFSLFLFVGISFFLWHLSKLFEEDFESQNDILVTVTSVMGDRDYEPNSLAEYQLLTNQYLEDFNYLKGTGNSIYSDTNFSSGMASRFSPATYESDRWRILFQYTADIEQHYLFRTDFSENNSSLSPMRPKAVTSVDFIDFHFGAIKIHNGRNFTQEEIENGEHVCLVATESVMYDGSVHHLEVGDKVPLSVYLRNNEEIKELYSSQCTIVGEYEIEKPLGNGVVPIEVPIYLPMAYYQEAIGYLMPSLLSEDKIAELSYRFQPMVFQVDSFENLENLIAEIERTSLYVQGYTNYSSNIQKGMDLLVNFTAMASSFRLLAIVCVIISSIGAFVFQLVDFRYRYKEFSIYISLGLSKIELMKQFICENFFLFLLAWIGSYVVSLLSVRGLTQFLFGHYFQYRVSGRIMIQVFVEMAWVSLMIVFLLLMSQWLLLKNFSTKGAQCEE